MSVSFDADVFSVLLAAATVILGLLMNVAAVVAVCVVQPRETYGALLYVRRLFAPAATDTKDVLPAE
jgi:hypothetical protein